MSLPRIKFVMASQAQLATEDIVPGRFIVTYDGRMYLDSFDGETRYTVTDIVELSTEEDRLAIEEPVEKFYYVSETSKLYRHNGIDWACLNPNPPYIGEDGKILLEFLPIGDDGGSIVVLDEYGLIPTKYLMIDPDEPSADSTDEEITSSRRLWLMLGAGLGSLQTTAKTIVGAINELFTSKLNRNETAANSEKLGGLEPTEFVRSPEGQPPDAFVMMAPRVKGSAPTLKSIDDFVTTEGDNAVIASNITPVVSAGKGHPGEERSYARADHQHPIVFIRDPRYLATRDKHGLMSKEDKTKLDLMDEAGVITVLSGPKTIRGNDQNIPEVARDLTVEEVKGMLGLGESIEAHNVNPNAHANLDIQIQMVSEAI